MELPYHLRTLAGVSGEVHVTVDEPATLRGVLDAVEARYPMLRGTIREYETRQRRGFLRVFAGGEGMSYRPMDEALPACVAAGTEPLIVLGAVAGGCGPGLS